jgi:hypothetical protein
MAQVQHLPTKWKTLNSNPNNTKKKPKQTKNLPKKKQKDLNTSTINKTLLYFQGFLIPSSPHLVSKIIQKRFYPPQMLLLLSFLWPRIYLPPFLPNCSIYLFKIPIYQRGGARWQIRNVYCFGSMNEKIQIKWERLYSEDKQRGRAFPLGMHPILCLLPGGSKVFWAQAHRVTWLPQSPLSTR